MHAAAAHAINVVSEAHRRTAQISIAHHERRLLPRDPSSSVDRAVSRVPDFLFNRWFLRSCAAGRMLRPVGHGEVVPGLAGSLTYLGLNHYTSESVSLDIGAPGMLFARHEAVPGLPLSGAGWAIDATGLRNALTDLWREFGLPIMVTENGVSDDHDELRPAYLRDHLTQWPMPSMPASTFAGTCTGRRGITSSGLRDTRQRFGLIAVNRDTQERIPKPSAALFAQICRTHEVPDDVDPQAIGSVTASSASA